MDLSIIIVSYNTKNLTENCIRSILLAYWHSSYEIIVVDNNSHDGSVEMIREYFPTVKLIVNHDNKLFAIANNQGASVASGRWLLLLNSDTIIYDNNVQDLLDFADTMPKDVICVGPKLLNKDRSLQSQGMFGDSHYDMIVKHFKLGTILPSFIGKVILPPGTYRWNKNKAHEVGWIGGAAMMIRSKDYMKLGGLNERLEFYGEEPEFCYRARKNGYHTWYYPHSEIIHMGGGSSKNKKVCDEQLLTGLRRYEKLVGLTVGHQYAIGTSRITMLAYWVKYLLSRNKKVLSLINHEKEVIRYLKKADAEETKKRTGGV